MNKSAKILYGTIFGEILSLRKVEDFVIVYR